MVGGLFWLLALRVQHDVVNPQVRANLVDDPQRSIDVRRGFHSKLGEVISADNTIISLLNQMSQYRTTHTDWQHDNYYANLEIQLTGDEQIRANTIGEYNAYAGNPDNGKFRDIWLPAQLQTAPLPADDQQTVTDLTDEVQSLSTANSRQG